MSSLHRVCQDAASAQAPNGSGSTPSPYASQPETSLGCKFTTTTMLLSTTSVDSGSLCTH